MARIDYDFEKKRQLMSDDLLSDVYDYMKEEAQITRDVAAEGKWRELIYLNKSISSPECSHIKLGGTPECLYEKFYRAEPRPLCSKARYLTVMRLVYGFELANIDRVCDSTMLKHLSQLFYFFDVFGSATGEATDQIDWKSLVFALRLLQYPHDSISTQMEWGFAVFTSDGAFDELLSGIISQDSIMALCTVGGATDTAVSFLTQAVNQTLLNLREELTDEANEEALGPPVSGIQMKFKYELFQRLLSTPPLSELMKPSRRIKFLCVWEEWYHPVVIDYLLYHRKDKFNLEKGELYRKVLEKRCKYAHLKLWGAFVMKRQRARALIIEFIKTFRAVNQRLGFDSLLRNAMENLGAMHIQRFTRGWISRCYVWNLKYEIWAATMCQSHYRRHMAQHRLNMEYERRRKSSTDIQRYFRGRQGRVYAKNYLQNHYMKNHARLKRMRQEWERKLHIRCAKLIQRTYRKHAGLDAAKARMAELAGRGDVQGMMDIAGQQHWRSLELYMDKVKTLYLKYKEDELQRRVDDEKSTADKWKILHYRRLKALEAYQEEVRSLSEHNEQLEAGRLKKWQDQWEGLMGARAEDERIRVERVLEQPEKGTGERHERAELLRRVKQRSKVVMKREEDAGYQIEYVESEIMAREEIIQEMMQTEKESVKREWEEAEEVHQQEMEERAAEKRKQEMEQDHLDEINAAQTFLRAYRAHNARKNLRKIIEEVVEKRFAPEERAPYYVNTRTDEVKWTKPLLLGKWRELEYVDEWILMTDKDFGNRKFLYNACTMEMTWDKPKKRMYGTQGFSEQAEAWVRGEGMMRQQLAMYTLKHGEGLSMDELIHKWFYEVDLDRSGFINLDEMQAMLIKAGLRMRQEQLERCIQAADSDNDGKVTRDDLMRWLSVKVEDVIDTDIEWLRSLPPERRNIEFLDNNEEEDKRRQQEEEARLKEEERLRLEREEEEELAKWEKKTKTFENMGSKEEEKYTYWVHCETGEERVDNPATHQVRKMVMIDDDDELTPDEQIKIAFYQFDKDNSRYLDHEELGNLVTFCRGKKVKERELKRIFKEIDSSNDGWVSLAEFQLWWRRQKHKQNMLRQGKAYLLSAEDQIEHEDDEESEDDEECWEELKDQHGRVYYNNSKTGEYSEENPKIRKQMKGVLEEYGSGMTPEDRIKVAFDAFDPDGAGVVPVSDLYRLISSLGTPIADDQLYYAQQTLDPSKSNFVNLRKFCPWYLAQPFSFTAEKTAIVEVPAEGMGDWEEVNDGAGSVYFINNSTGETSWENPGMRAGMGAMLTQHGSAGGSEADNLKAVFQNFDADGTGYIEAHELGQLLAALGFPMDGQQLGAAATALDTSGDGWISFQEFKQWWVSS
jgi:Ca2+-binding EF-hand superfamily protein